jgi:hypothetical protein
MGGRVALPLILVHGVPDTDHVWHRLIPDEVVRELRAHWG